MGNEVPSQTIDNEKIPTDITKQGWIFDPKEGQRIQGMYIFGEDNTADKNNLRFTLDGAEIEALPEPAKFEDLPEPAKFDDSIVIVMIITAIAVAAAVFYMKGYKR